MKLPFHLKRAPGKVASFVDYQADRATGWVAGHLHRGRTRNSSGALVAAICDGLASGDFWLAFQPIVCVRSGEVVGAEALLRWNHPLYGLLLPGSFLGAIDPQDDETKGLLACFVVDEVCAQMALLPADNSGLATKYVSLNVEPTLIADSGFGNVVKESCARHNIDPRRLVIEVLETEHVSSVLEFPETIRTLRDTGLGLALDDFGSGYSSLARVAGFVIDKVKLSADLVCEIPASRRHCIVLSSIIEMLHKLDLEITAEGVETLDQARWLMHYNVDNIQGFYLSEAFSDLGDALASAPRYRERLARGGVSLDPERNSE